MRNLVRLTTIYTISEPFGSVFFLSFKPSKQIEKKEKKMIHLKGYLASVINEKKGQTKINTIFMSLSLVSSATCRACDFFCFSCCESSERIYDYHETPRATRVMLILCCDLLPAALSTSRPKLLRNDRPLKRTN